MTKLLSVLAEASKGSALLFHGAAGLWRHRGYVFLAPSGGGKSALAALCDRARTSVLADDAVLVLAKGEDFFLRPLPRQSGSIPASIALGNQSRLRRLFFLEKARDPRAEPVAPLKAIARCLKDSLLLGFMYMAPAERLAVLDRCIRLFRSVPAYVLHFAKDNRFWDVIDALDRCEKAFSAG